MNRIELATHESCTGCAACHDVCSIQCISMEYDGLHLFPKINRSICIECGLCMSTCPVLSKTNDTKIDQRYYAAWSNDLEERKNGTSGGIGTALARYAIQNGYIVCGAGFNNEWYLRHTLAETEEEILLFRGSKYLQSDTTGILKSIKKNILDGKKVFFFGTPCQVEAVKSIIPARYQDSLATCGIICHGVNSPVVWGEFVKYLESKHNATLLSYNFRSKLKGWGEDGGGGKLNIQYELSDNQRYFEPSWRNLFHCWFGQHYIIRESCLRCRYRTKYRNSDITIGDFWGLRFVLPELKDTRLGVSVLITSSIKGEQIVSCCQTLNTIRVQEAETVPVLRGFIDKKSEDSKKEEISRKKAFEAEYIDEGFRYMAAKYAPQSYWSRLKSSLKARLGL